MDVIRHEVPQHLSRIEASSCFARAERLARFLRFIVDESLAGRAAQLKEYSIAIEVFGRPASYDPQIDSLVRVQASQLRSRLQQYYETEGSAEPLRIEIPKGGYEPVFRRVGPPPVRRRKLLPLAVTAAVVLGIGGVALLVRARSQTARADAQPSVVVLPFADMSPAGDQAYLCDGITEELIHSLSRIQGLRVVARTSAFQYKGRSGDVRRIGRDLNVSSVVEGSVRRDGSTLRVTAQLIDTANGYHVWSAAYDRRLNDTFAVEEELAQAIAERLRPVRGEARTGRAAAPNPEAYQHYLTGVYWRTNPSVDHLRKAIAEFRAAIATDPRYAAAHAALAEAFARLHYFEIVPAGETAGPARAAAARALELDDQLPRAHEAAALVHLIDWDLRGAESEFRRALQLNSADVRIRYAYAQLCLNPAGRYEEAIGQLRDAMRLDPVARYLITEVGNSYLLSRQFAHAREEFRRGLALNPKAAGTRTNLASTDSAEGLFQEAMTGLERVNTEMPGDPWVEGHLGYAYARAGHKDEARRVLANLTGARGGPALHVAAVYMGLGESGRALDWLDRGLATHSPSMYWLSTDFRFAALHADSRYTKLAARLP